MQAGIYKKGQGYWVRLMSAIAYGLVVAMGGYWLWDLLANAQFGEMQPVYVQMISLLVVFVVFGWIGYQVLARRHRTVDFLIATEGEMKKVNWSSRREIIASTRVVVMLTLLIALLCQVFDIGFSAFFRWVNVLQS